MDSTQQKKRIYRSRSEWDDIVREFRASGLSQAEFCRQRSLSAPMLGRALARTESSTPTGFARLLAPRPQDLIVVELSDGIRVNLRGIDPVVLIRGLSR
jgi:hypothetical protein